MKALILSFFAVILGYSLLFNEKEASESTTPVVVDNNSYVDEPVRMFVPDSVMTGDEIAYFVHSSFYFL